MDKAKKKQVKKAVTWVLLAALVAGLAAMPLVAKSEAESDGPVATVHSGTLEKGTVQTALHGGGTLVTEDVEDVTIPGGVKIKSFLVKNGDTVAAGTPLAEVDKVSVMTAITEVTETMEYLQQEMKDAKNEKIDSTVSATAGGRVKQVFAQKGDSVQEVMLQHGALALLSLDGLMAVKIEKKMELPTGDTVTVAFPDGTEITGRVGSNLDGVIVITMEDDSYPIGETVTVTTRDGAEVGQGELYVHSAWTATAFSGTIQTVYAKEETKVGAGASLFTLTDTEFQGTLDYLSSLHREYEELMQDLFRMYNSGTIDAPCDGTVSGIDKDSAHLLGADEGHWQITLLDQRTVQSFVAFAARVTGEKDGSLVLSVDPGLIPLETLHNLCRIPVDPKTMTHRRTYPADTTVFTQNASGALVPGGNARVGDVLLFVGNEEGVLWVVDVEKSVPTTGFGVMLTNSSGGETADTSACVPEQKENCPSTAGHKPECIKSCDPEGTCNATQYHYANCIKACSMASSTGNCPASSKHYLECIESCKPENGVCAKNVGHHKKECIQSCQHASSLEGCKETKYPHYPDCVGSCIQSNGTKDCPAIRHLNSCIESCTHKKELNQCLADPNHYPDCIECCVTSESASEICPGSVHNTGCFFYEMTYTAKVALVTQVGSSHLVVRWDASGNSYDVVKSGSGWRFKNPSDFNPKLLVNEGTIAVGNPKAFKPGDVILDITGYKGKEAKWSNISVYTNIGAAAGGMGDLSGLMAGMGDLSKLLAGMGGLSGFGNFGFYSTPPVDENELFDLEGDTLMTVSPQKTVSVTIQLDEQDIARVHLNQKAAVKVEALGETLFEAVITEIATRGTNSGGSSKFAVKLEMDKAKDMLDGMSATASLLMERREDVLVIPVAALTDLGSQTAVCTSLDEDGNPANPVPVTVGISDGVTAEILSGLQEGDTYYYSVYDVLNEDTGVEERFTLS